MPTKRTRISRAMAPQVSPTVLNILSEGLFPPIEGENDRERIEWKYFTDDETKQKILAQCRDYILDEWIRQRPGTRPSLWWATQAPEKSRRRLGGIGDPAHEHLAYVETYEYGIPAAFLDQRSIDYYNGRAIDVHGNKIGDHKEGDFSGRAIDPADPPRYESEATFLQRHNLLTPEEKRRLRKKGFEPEIIHGE
ncbi:MAG: hypothetical protein U1E51_21315 [Candidatus Binatia bacterium]|nr:hypothetical protein [Candidatus Binatia bacterium]